MVPQDHSGSHPELCGEVLLSSESLQVKHKRDRKHEKEALPVQELLNLVVRVGQRTKNLPGTKRSCFNLLLRSFEV